MRFLHISCNWFKKFQNPKQLGTRHEFVSPAGSVGRFIYDVRKIDRKSGKPKQSAFTPERHPDTGQFETSVCGRNGVTDERFWFLGNAIRPGLEALAAVEISVANIQLSGLRCEPTPETQPIDYPEHGVIVGWDPGEDKEKRMAAQQELAANSSRVLWPSSRVRY